MQTTFTVTPGVPLSTDFDVDARLAALAAHHTVKGMFTAAVVRQLRPDEFQKVKTELVAPPRAAHRAFADYPVVDHQRLTVTLVRRLHPTLPIAEALRRFERSNASRFADTTLGRVMVAMLRDPAAGLLKLPEISRMVSNVGDIHASRAEDHAVRLVYAGYSGFVDCAIIGSLEGVVMFFGKRPTIEARIRSSTDAEYVVRWADDQPASSRQTSLAIDAIGARSAPTHSRFTS